MSGRLPHIPLIVGVGWLLLGPAFGGISHAQEGALPLSTMKLVLQGEDPHQVLSGFEALEKKGAFPVLHSEYAAVRDGKSTSEQLKEEREIALSLFRFLQAYQGELATMDGKRFGEGARALLRMEHWVTGGEGYRNVVLANYINWVVTVRLAEKLVRGQLSSDEASRLHSENVLTFFSPTILSKVIEYENGKALTLQSAASDADALRAAWALFEPGILPFAWWALPSDAKRGPKSLRTSYLLAEASMPLLLSRFVTQNMGYAQGLSLLILYRKNGGVFPNDAEKPEDQAGFRKQLEVVLENELKKMQLLTTGKSPTIDLPYQTFRIGLYPGSAGLPPSLLQERLPGVSTENLQFFVRE